MMLDLLNASTACMMCRPDARNALYQDTIKKGDQLLNRIQKLSRVIDVE